MKTTKEEEEGRRRRREKKKEGRRKKKKKEDARRRQKMKEEEEVVGEVLKIKLKIVLHILLRGLWLLSHLSTHFMKKTIYDFGSGQWAYILPDILYGNGKTL